PVVAVAPIVVACAAAAWPIRRTVGCIAVRGAGAVPGPLVLRVASVARVRTSGHFEEADAGGVDRGAVGGKSSVDVDLDPIAKLREAAAFEGRIREVDPPAARAPLAAAGWPRGGRSAQGAPSALRLRGGIIPRLDADHAGHQDAAADPPFDGDPRPRRDLPALLDGGRCRIDRDAVHLEAGAPG